MILVTGASGHLGKSLASALLADGNSVRILVDKNNPQIDGAEIMKGHLLNIESLKAAVSGVDTIYHLAAIVDYSSVNKQLMYDVNVTGTKNILSVSKASRFIYMSSTSVYGNKMLENPATPATKCNPSTYYGKTKMLAEKLVFDAGGIVVRAPVIFGNGFNGPFIDLMQRLESKSMPIIGNGQNRLQWVHIDDLIDALELAMKKGERGRAYIIAGKEVVTQLQLYSMISNAMGIAPPAKHVPSYLVYALAYCQKMKSMITKAEPKIKLEYLRRIASDRTFDISMATSDLGFNPKMGYAKWINDLSKEYKSSKRGV